MSLTHTFRSADTGAPALANTAGSFLALLDAILVNGYNSQTATSVTRSGTTVTVNKTGHNFRNGQIITVSGANETDYNVTARCAYVDANNITYQIATTPASPATGTITVKVAGAGWTKPYTGTNKAAFLQPSGGTTRYYLRVDDSATGDALVRGYESMSDVDTGTAPFPTTAQIALASGLYITKPAGSTRTWRAFVNAGSFYFLDKGESSPSWTTGVNGAGMFFGNYVTYIPTDTTNAMLIAGAGAGEVGASTRLNNVSSSDSSGHYYARNYASAAGAVIGKKNVVRHLTSSVSYIGGTGTAYPDAGFGGIVMDRVIVAEGNVYRGHLPGIYGVAHGSGVTIGDTWAGGIGGDLSGKSFEAYAPGSGVSSGLWAIQTSDDW